MKYRVKNSTKKERKYFSNGRFRAERSYRGKTEEPIDFSSLFEFAEQYDVPLLPVPRKKPSVFARLIFWIKKRVFGYFFQKVTPLINLPYLFFAFDAINKDGYLQLWELQDLNNCIPSMPNNKLFF